MSRKESEKAPRKVKGQRGRLRVERTVKEYKEIKRAGTKEVKRAERKR